MNLELRLANYITRYAPSREKMLQYLAKKHYQGDGEQLLSDIGYSEDQMLGMWMRTFIVRSIGERDVRIKLMKKWFPKEKIDSFLESNTTDIRDWESHKPLIESVITRDLARGKSKRVIGMVLISKYPYFRDDIWELLSQYDDETGLVREIEKLLGKYRITEMKEKKKFYDALLRRGFSYDQVSKYLKNRENT